MTPRIPSFDFDRLEKDGFAILPGLLRPDEIVAFEAAISVAGERLAAARGVERRSTEAIADVLKASGNHRGMLFDHIKRLFVIERFSVAIGAALEEAGLFAHSGIEVPAVWPTLRADLPGESTYVLNLHQDFATTRSQTAWRLWVPLRDVDPHFGTMELAPGSHLKGPYAYHSDDQNAPHILRSDIDRIGCKMTAVTLQAGSAVLIDPRIVHGSVPNRSNRTKWVLLVQVQDLARIVDPEHTSDPLARFVKLSEWYATPRNKSGAAT